MAMKHCARNVLRKPRPRVAVFYVSPRFQLADVLPAKAASCRSWFAFAQGITVRYAVGRLGTRSHAFFLHETRVRILATRSDTQLPYSYGKQSLACEDQTKVWRNARLPRGAKLADSARHTRFFCAILGLSLRASILGLRKKILGWCESALCA